MSLDREPYQHVNYTVWTMASRAMAVASGLLHTDRQYAGYVFGFADALEHALPAAWNTPAVRAALRYVELASAVGNGTPSTGHDLDACADVLAEGGRSWR